MATQRSSAPHERWTAVEARDARADGTFVFGVTSTGIYCRPSCPARRRSARGPRAGLGRRGLPPAVRPRRAPDARGPGRASRREPAPPAAHVLSLIHISEPTRQAEISYAV